MKIFQTSLLAPVAALAFAGAAHASTSVGPVVGEATLVIGQGRIVSSGGTVSKAQPGSPIRVGDRIETAAGGHVYVRFVDGANVSVRPMSNMLIESYSHNPQQPQLGAIKFQLSEGAARSITGSWGEAARERFRLNTPVAAIGVRGTDFTVRSSDQGTAATVYTGAIVLAPLSNGCAQSVGPCQTSSATLLSGDMRGQMLELGSRENAPQLVASVTPVVAPRAAPAAASTEVVAFAGTARPVKSGEGLHEAAPAAKTLDAENLGVTLASLEIPTPKPPTPVTPEVPVTPTPKPPVVEVVPDPAPVPVVPVLPPQVRQLAWANPPWTARFDADAFIKTYADALAAGMQRLDGNTVYTLFGTASSTATQSNLPAESVVNFRLANASAQLSPKFSWEKPQALEVVSGQLQIDFSNAVFRTALAINGTGAGLQGIQATGVVQANGLMRQTSGDSSIAGAVTADRQEAGYAFIKPLTDGSAIQGVTLWGR